MSYKPSAKDDALKWLAGKMRTEHEVRQRLLKKGFQEDEVQETIDYLKGYRYLDDDNYTEAYIRDKCRFSPSGRYKLYQALRLKGIDKARIQMALQSEFPEETEKELAYKLALKQQSRGRSRVQTMRYLHGKGFAPAAIRVVQEMAWDEEADSP